MGWEVALSCYGETESWYLEKVPSAELPAAEIDGVGLFTGFEAIVFALEKIYHPLPCAALGDVPQTLRLELS